MPKLKTKIADLPGQLILREIHSKVRLRGHYMLTFKDPRRFDNALEIRRIVTDDTEGMTPERVQSEIDVIEKFANRILKDIGAI